MSHALRQHRGVLRLSRRFLSFRVLIDTAYTLPATSVVIKSRIKKSDFDQRNDRCINCSPTAYVLWRQRFDMIKCSRAHGCMDYIHFRSTLAKLGLGAEQKGASFAYDLRGNVCEKSA